MTELTQVGEGSFQAEVLEAPQPVLVEFTAVWCGPCRMLDPIVKQLAKEWNGQVKVVKLDVDNSPDIVTEFQVMGVPTLLLFVAGKPVQRITGYQPKDRILAKLKPYL